MWFTGCESSRRGDGWFKRSTARGFVTVMNRLSDMPIPNDAGDFRLMSRPVVEVLKHMPERHRFLRGMVSWTGFRQTAMPYDRPERFAGTTKYPLRKMVRFALDGLLSFSTRPLQISIALGLSRRRALPFLASSTRLVLRIFTSVWVEGWTALMITVLFLGGVQMVSLGIIGEYIGRIYGEVQRRPLYVVRESIGFDLAIDGGTDPLAARMKRALQLLLGLGLAGFFLWLTLRQVDTAGLAKAAQNLSLGWMAAAPALLATGYAARVFRWRMMLRPHNPALGFGRCGVAYVASIATNNLLPFRAGRYFALLWLFWLAPH